MNNLIFHRFDDIGPYHHSTVKILDGLEKLGVPSILAVIPKQLDSKMAAYLKGLKHCIIAQHGVGHINGVHIGWLDEFPESMDKEQVSSQIKEGKNYLEKVFERPIGIYVPPWNHTSRQTIEIIEELGFQVYSSQYNQPVDSKMLQIPISMDVVKSYHPKPTLKSYPTILEEIQSLMKEQDIPLMGIMYHPNELLEGDVMTILDLIEAYQSMTMEYASLKKHFVMTEPKGA